MNGWLPRLVLGSMLAGLFACGPHPPGFDSAPLPATNETLAPVAIAVRTNATYVVDATGAVVRMREGARDTIARIDDSLDSLRTSSATGAGKLSVGDDESVWYTTTALVRAWNGSAWVTHDLTPVAGGGTYGIAAPLGIAARSIDDAWAVVYAYERATGSTAASFGPVFRLCHWDGRAWTCEVLPAATMGGAWELVASPPLIGVSASFVWMLGADHVVWRRGCDGVWTALSSDVCIRDMQVVDDGHAFVGGCEAPMGVAAWNGSRFESIDDQAEFFVARSGADAWLVHVDQGIHTENHRSISDWRQYVASHYDGTSVTEIGHVNSDIPIDVAPSWASPPGHVQIVPTTPSAARLHVIDRTQDEGWFAATANP